MGKVILRKQDGVEAMAGLESGSIDLIFTDLPCPGGDNGAESASPMLENLFVTPGWEDFGPEQWRCALGRFFREARRVLRREGAMVLSLPLAHLSTVTALGSEGNFSQPSFGVWHKKAGDPRRSVRAWVCWGAMELPDFLETGAVPMGQRRYGKHPEQMPESVPEHFLSRLTMEGDWVLDPFMGSGTTGVAAQRLGRNFIGAELDGGYYAMAKARIRGQSQEKPKAMDLFCGSGGLSLGFARRGFDVVLAADQDPDMIKAYRENHPETEILLGDLLEADIPAVFGPYAGRIDVLLAGPPFQEEGDKALLDGFLRVLETVKPAYFVIETDSHLLTAEGGRPGRVFKKRLEKVGYRVNTGILNAADYGVPQQRKRSVLLGKLGAWAPELPMETGESVSVWDAIGDLAFLASGEGAESQEYREPPVSAYGRSLRGESSVLHNHTATRHAPLVLERLAMIPPEGGREALPEEQLTKSSYSGVWCRMVRGEKSVPIGTRFDTPASGRFTHPYLDRTITVREAARIQSFPDEYVFLGSKSAQMKQVGTALPPKLAQAIAGAVQEDMER